jgi:hypothetical protein
MFIFSSTNPFRCAIHAIVTFPLFDVIMLARETKLDRFAIFIYPSKTKPDRFAFFSTQVKLS